MKAFAVALALLLPTPALAQEHAAHGAAPAADLPAICLKETASMAHDSASMQMPGD